MPLIDDLRAKYKGYSDDEILSGLQATKYPDYGIDEIKSAIGYKAPERGFVRGAADLGLEVASGVTRGVGMLANTFGANNPVASAARSADEFIREYLSAQSKEDSATAAAILAEAEDQGVGAQVVAGLRAFGQAPLSMLANTAGMAIPTIAGGAAAMGGRVAAGGARAIGTMAGIGAASGVGEAKGGIFDAVKAEYMKQPGMTEAEAELRAEEAQAYGSANAGNLAVAGGLGAVAGATGFQPAAARLLKRGGILADGAETGMLRSVAGDRVADFAETRAGSALAGGLVEGGTEFLQGGQQQYASNVALQNEGFDTPTWRGVVSQGAMEAIAGGVMGAGFGAMEGKKRAADPLAPEAVASVLAAPTLDDAIKAAAEQTQALPWNGKWEPEGGFQSSQTLYAFADGSAGTLEETVEELSNRATRDNLERWFARAPTPMTQEKAEDIVALAEERGKGEMLAIPLPDGAGYTVIPSKWAAAPELSAYVEQAAAAYQVEQQRRARIEQIQNEPLQPRSRTDGQLIDPSGPNAVAGYVQRMQATNTPAARAFVQDFNAGRITPDDVMGLLGAKPKRAEPTADQRLAAAAAQKQPILPTDLLTGDGMPYGSRTAAGIRAKKEDGTVVPVEGGWVVRKEEAPNVPVPDLARTSPGPAGASDGASPAAVGSGGTVRPDPAAPREPVRGSPAPEPSGGTADAVGAGGPGNTALTEGQTITLDGKPWTVGKSTPTMVMLQDGDGNAKAVGVGSKTWAKIESADKSAPGADLTTPAIAAPDVSIPAPAANTSAERVDAQEADDSIDPFTLDKRALNQRIDQIVASGEAADSIGGFLALRKRYMKATGKPSIPPAGSRAVPLYPEGTTPNAAAPVSAPSSPEGRETVAAAPAARLMPRYGESMTIEQAVTKARELEADSRTRKAKVGKTPTAFMSDIERNSAAQSATLARRLREDIRDMVAGFPDMRAEYEALTATTPAATPTTLPDKIKARNAAAEPAPAPEAVAAPEPAPAPEPVRNEAVIELRKRVSVLKSLRKCLG